MKNYREILSVILFAFFLISCAETSQNESNTEGGKEKVGSPLTLADPYILLDGDTYYAYGTMSPDGIVVYKSNDLKNWKKAALKSGGLALNKKDSYEDKWFWAPEVYKVGNSYIMYYSANEHICAAVSDNPEGPFVQKEKKPILPGKAIDHHLFIDDDGTPYIFFVQFTNGNEIWVAELEKDLMTIKENTTTLCFGVSQDWEKEKGVVNEGPFVFKNGDTYVITYSGNDFRSQSYGVGFATAKSPLGKWEKSESNPILSKPKTLKGTGHHSLFKDKYGKNKIVFHSHLNDSLVSPRVLHISNFTVTGSGYETIVKVDTNYFTPTEK
jgi:beta-xylosidase